MTTSGGNTMKKSNNVQQKTTATVNVYYECSLSTKQITCLLIGIVTFIKILLIPSYKSTDFDVHRNWMSLTTTLPIREWYFDTFHEQTVHTLDYPPSFAYFEYIIGSNPISVWLMRHEFLDSECFKQCSDDETQTHVSTHCIMYQRISVIVSDIVYIVGCHFFAKTLSSVVKQQQQQQPQKHNKNHYNVDLSPSYICIMILLVSNFGLLLLDHVHFQYNGFLLGILLSSISFMIPLPSNDQSQQQQRRMIVGALLYAILLGLKHLYLTLAPLYFIYLLRHYCFSDHKFSFQQFTLLGVTTLGVLIMPYIPFVVQDNPTQQLQQMFSRLFPFQRGLVHDYWAGNVWAILLSAEKVFNKLLSQTINAEEYIPPSICILLTFVSMIPILIKCWTTTIGLTSSKSTTSVASKSNKVQGNNKHVVENTRTNPLLFVEAVIYCSFSSFLFGYHVHEKAIMTALLPLSGLMVVVDHPQNNYTYTFIMAMTFGHLGLLPLLFRPYETCFKIFMYGTYTCIMLCIMEYVTQIRNQSTLSTTTTNKSFVVVPSQRSRFVRLLSMLVVCLAFAVTIFTEVLYPLWMKPNYEFLPLLVTSLTCALDLGMAWLIQIYHLFFVGK